MEYHMRFSLAFCNTAFSGTNSSQNSFCQIYKFCQKVHENIVNNLSQIQTKLTDTTATAEEQYQHATNSGHQMSTKLEENLQVPATAEQGQILYQLQLSTHTVVVDVHTMTRSAMLLHWSILSNSPVSIFLYNCQTIS